MECTREKRLNSRWWECRLTGYFWTDAESANIQIPSALASKITITAFQVYANVNMNWHFVYIRLRIPRQLSEIRNLFCIQMKEQHGHNGLWRGEWHMLYANSIVNLKYSLAGLSLLEILRNPESFWLAVEYFLPTTDDVTENDAQCYGNLKSCMYRA